MAPSYVGTSQIGDGTNIGAMSHRKRCCIGTECKSKAQSILATRPRLEIMFS